MDMTLMPVLVSAGMMPAGPMNGVLWIPNILGMLGPVMSASSTPTGWPSCRRATASRALTSDLPTPPLPLMTATTCRMWLKPSAVPDCPIRPSPIRRRSSSVISARSIRTSRTPSNPSTAARAWATIWSFSGHPEMVRARVRATSSPWIRMLRTMPSSTRFRPNSGSITPDRAALTCSSVIDIGVPPFTVGRRTPAPRHRSGHSPERR